MVPATGTVCKRNWGFFVLVLFILVIPSLPMISMAKVEGDPVSPSPSRGIRDIPCMPPPPGPDGVRHGNWVISCGPSQPINITYENIKIQGNITIGAGSILNLEKGSKIIMVQDLNMSFVLSIQDFSSLKISEGSLVDVTAVQARPGSDISIDHSSLIVRTNAHIDSSMFAVQNSTVTVVGNDGAGTEASSSAGLLIDTETLEVINSTIEVQGGLGGEGGIGGDSSAQITTITGRFDQMTIKVTAGNGGHGRDPISGPGGRGGQGGSALVDLRMTNNGPLKIKNSKIDVNGGAGGTGGNGAMSQTLPGGSGGLGGESGQAQLNITAGSIDLDDTVVSAYSNRGGNGGKGGDSVSAAGGDGAAGGTSSNAKIELNSIGQLTLIDSTVAVYAGSGGYGGFMGDGNPIGLSGDGGNGGSSSLKVRAANYLATNSFLITQGGSGGWGGLGAVSTGDGGDGGDAVCDIETTLSIISNGKGPTQTYLGAVGGNGGNAGESLNNNSSPDIRGKGGNGGKAQTVLMARSNIEIAGTWIKGSKSNGGSGSVSGVGGTPQITVLTPHFNLSNAVVDWTLSGFAGHDLGQIRNTTFLASPIVNIDPKETGVKVMIYWTVDVTMPQIAYGDWMVFIFSGKLEDRIMITSKVLAVPYSHAYFELLGAVFESTGPVWRNYSIIARNLNGQSEYSTVAQFILNENKQISLKYYGYCCPPISISFPDNKMTINSWELSPCRTPTHEESLVGLGAPGCLRIEGDAYSFTNRPIGYVKEVTLTLSNPEQGTIVYRNNSKPAVRYDPPVTTKPARIQWMFNWDIGEVDIANKTYRWSEGVWTITATVIIEFQDIPNNETKTVSYNTSNWIIVHHAPLVLSTQMRVNAGLPVTYTIPLRATGVSVNFTGASVNASGKIIRMEWDYNSDGIVDLAYTPSDCKPQQTCLAPTSSFVYTNESIYDAKFCAIDNFGNRECDTKKVQIMKEQEPTVAGLPRSLLIALTVSIIAICTIVITALVITSLSEATKYSIMAFILVPLYSRLKKEEMLDNYTRGEIRGYIVANPGAHYSRIKRDLSLNNGTLIYHLTQLEREGFIYSHRDDYYRRFYPRGRKPRPGANLTTVQETIIETLLDNPGLSAEELAERLNKSRKVTNYHLVWLRRWGLIEAKDDGRRKTYTVIYEDETEKKQDIAKAVPGEEDTEGPSEPSGP